MTENIVLTNGRVWAYHNDKYTPITGHNVFINGKTGKIDKISVDSDFTGYKAIDVQGHHIVPGAIDTHCHGISNYSVGNVTEGIANRFGKNFDSTEKGIWEVYNESSLVMAQHGTTSWIPTAMATEEVKLKTSLEVMMECIEKRPAGAEILGAGIEGTFLYNDPKYTGCLNPEFFYQPTIIKYKSLIGDIAKEHVKWVAVGPRYGRAPTLARYLAENGILVGVGHSGAKKEQVLGVYNEISQVGRGGMFYTHLYNGPNGSNNKPSQGLVMQAVVPSIHASFESQATLHAQLILDGEHHNAGLSIEALKNFGKRRTVAITDNIGVGPQSNVKTFQMLGKLAKIGVDRPNAIWLKEPDNLFGSRATTMDHMLPYILDFLSGYPIYSEHSTAPLFENELEFNQRMDYALHMLCKAPANMYKLTTKGILAQGYHADIAVLDIDDPNVKVKKVFVHGKEIDMEAKPL